MSRLFCSFCCDIFSQNGLETLQEQVEALQNEVKDLKEDATGMKEENRVLQQEKKDLTEQAKSLTLENMETHILRKYIIKANQVLDQKLENERQKLENERITFHCRHLFMVENVLGNYEKVTGQGIFG